jgi:molybdate transport system regulatory protein
MARLSIRIDLGEDARLGPGKVALLEQIAATGSISAAARTMGMSYKRAWDLVEEVNGMFDAPLVASQSGGRKGGGAALTPLGADIVTHYRNVVTAAEAASKPLLARIQKQVRT